ncbi:unannotated protein [freshwater metagenome]|uniref:Unannotated protein n=1 Tax=freshwater metagenome TaxID=449393 RepID=A0A6J6H202_9ZZZZ
MENACFSGANVSGILITRRLLTFNSDKPTGTKFPSFELIETSIFASILPGTSKRRVCAEETPVALLFKSEIAGIVTNLVADATGATKSAPSDRKPFLRSSNKNELTRPDLVLTAITIESSPGIKVSTEIALLEFAAIATLFGSTAPVGV